MGNCAERPKETSNLTWKDNDRSLMRQKVKREFNRKKKSGKYSLDGEKQDLLVSIIVNEKIKSEKFKRMKTESENNKDRDFTRSYSRINTANSQ